MRGRGRENSSCHPTLLESSYCCMFSPGLWAETEMHFLDINGNW
uniref:Uncharacterized protein n=1 Tax=Anguilla anguilla TaxID=7936 RepID=A0A0E9WHA8_ANGAN